MTEGDRGKSSKPILGEGTRVHVHMSHYDRRGPGQSLKTHPGWRYSKCMSICPNMTEGDRGRPSKPILGEGTQVQVHMSHYDRRGPGQSLKTHPGWRYSSACPYVPIWLKGTGAVPQNPSWVKVFECMSICPIYDRGSPSKGTGAVPQNPSWVKVLKCMSICPIMTEGDRGSPSKPILGEGTRVHVHMSHYDRRGPGQSLKTHPGWRYSNACPYVPIWLKGTRAGPQNPSWVKVLKCMVHMSHMSQNPSWVNVLEVHMSQYDWRGPGQSLKTHPGWRYSSACPYVPIWRKETGAKGTGRQSHQNPSHGWRYSSACPYVPIWPKGTGAVPQNPSWVKVLECMSICPIMTEGDRGSPWKPILGEGTRVHVHMSQYDWRGPGQVLKTHLGWRHSSAGPYVPVWPKGTGADPQNPSWVEVLECRSTCLNMSQGGQRGGCIPLEGEAFTIPSK